MLENCTLNKNTPVPLYFQLKSLIMDEIEKGEYQSGDAIPTEAELAAMFNISRTTVRQAMADLVRENVLYRIKSKGTFVSKPKVSKNITDPQYSYEEAVTKSGRPLQTKVLIKKVETAPQEAVRLGLCREGQQVIWLRRLRVTDQEPIEWVDSFIPYPKFAFVLDVDLEKETLHSLLNADPNYKIYRTVRIIEAVAPSKEDVQLLDMEPSQAIQRVTTLRYTEDGEQLDCAIAYYRGDMNKIYIERINETEQAGI